MTIEIEKVHSLERNILAWDKGGRRVTMTNEYGPNRDMVVYVSALKKSVYRFTDNDIEHVKKLIIEQKPFEDIPVIFA